MTIEDFGRAVQRVYDAALKAGKTDAQAHRVAENFRSNLIKALTEAAMTILAKGEPNDRSA